MTSTCAGNGDVIEVALVNNMPDQALPATQRQFSSLVHQAAQGLRFKWRCYALPGVERSETARRYLQRSHEDIDALYRRGAHALIVTGAEPRATRLEEEPYWPDLRRLVDWARDNTLSTIWSCLAAHAAVLHLDGVERRRATKKISGVFTFEKAPQDWMPEPSARETHATLAFCELPGPREEEGAVAAFSFGRTRGAIEGVLSSAGVPLDRKRRSSKPVGFF